VGGAKNEVVILNLIVQRKANWICTCRSMSFITLGKSWREIALMRSRIIARRESCLSGSHFFADQLR